MKPTYEELEAQLAAAIESERVWETTMMQVCGEDGTASVAEKFAQLESQVNQLGAESAQMKAVIDSVTDLDNEPQFHEQGMGCGLEDRGITDRYEAMSYGWDRAMERVYGEVIPCAEELSFPATDAFLSRLRNEARAEGVEVFVAETSAGLRTAGGACGVIQEPYHEFADHLEDRGERFARHLREGKAGEVQS